MENQGFLTNESKISFVDAVISALNRCKSFRFSVSFIKKPGLALLESAIEDALARGVEGKILTSTYQSFTDIASLELFLAWQEDYPNFECHLENHSFGEDGFHTKGYIFSFDDHEEVIIGSSNITYYALRKNREWDVTTSIDNKSYFYQDVSAEFDKLWKATNSLTAAAIKDYKFQIEYSIDRWDMDFFDPAHDQPKRPNMMQRKALKELRRTRSMGVNRALVVAATGSGKTFLSAFDAHNFNAKKLLFIVHKDTILRDALATFASVFGTTRTYGIFDGQDQEVNADFLFASNQMMSRHLSLFKKDEFDYIIIDEVHHAAASTYKAIIEYFQPGFLLGLTATPERMDGQNVYDLFGYNVPFDLRLRDALLNDLIVPFHYYGIKDELLNYADSDTEMGIRRIVNELSSQANCEFVSSKIEKYRKKDQKLRCIGFCTNIAHAKSMSEEMNGLGYHCCYLTGANSTGERRQAFDRLEDAGDPLEIIFTVDILNEGIDVPSINMVLFLRPTESSTIFIQQLGRGLRHYEGKDYLTVLDFIANSYRRSEQIAVALGQLSKTGTTDKVTALERVESNFTDIGIQGLKIEFDDKAKKEIIDAISKTNFNHMSYLRADYTNFKSYLKLGPNEYPKHIDFICDAVSADLLRYTRRFDSYYHFLTKVPQSNLPIFNEDQTTMLKKMFFFLPLCRPEEYWIIQSLLDGGKSEQELIKELKNKEGYDEESLLHALKVLQNLVYATALGTEQDFAIVRRANDKYELSASISKEFKDWVLDLIDYGLARYSSEFIGTPRTLQLYHPYKGEQVYEVYNQNSLYRMTGVVYFGTELFLFIDLEKDLNPTDALNYKDKFLSNKLLQWESQTDTTFTNGKGQRLIKTGKAHILVRKVKKEDGIDKPFVYIGQGKLTNPRAGEGTKPTLLFDIELENQIPDEYALDFGIISGKDVAYDA